MTHCEPPPDDIFKARCEEIERGKPENYVDGRYDPEAAAARAREVELAGGTVEPPPVSTPDDASGYQSWLRRHIAKLEDLQAQRIRFTELRKKEMDTVIAEKQREIANLKAQQTIELTQSDSKEPSR